MTLFYFIDHCAWMLGWSMLILLPFGWLQHRIKNRKSDAKVADQPKAEKTSGRKSKYNVNFDAMEKYLESRGYIIMK